MRLVGTLAALAVLGGASRPGTAGCYVRQAVVQRVVVQKQVVVPVAAFVPLAVAVPAYSVGYSAAGVAPAPPANQPLPVQANGQEALIEEILRRVEERLIQRQQQPPQGPANLPLPQRSDGTSEAAAHQLLVRKCAACHTTAGVAKGDFVLFSSANQLADLTRAERGFAYLMAAKAKMPYPAGGDPKSPHALTDAELELLDRWAEAKPAPMPAPAPAPVPAPPPPAPL